MGYRVDYFGGKAVKTGTGQASSLVKKGITAVLVAAVLVLWLWPQGRRALGEYLIPGDPAVTTAALEELAQGLRSGQGLLDSLELFCRRVWEGAGLAVA